MTWVQYKETEEMFRANQNLTMLNSMLIIIFYIEKTAKSSSKSLTLE